MNSDSAVGSTGRIRPTGRWGSQLFCLAILAVLGVGLIGMAVPRAVAAWLSYDGSSTFDRLSTGAAHRDETLADAISNEERAIAWRPSGRRLIVLGLLEAERGRHQPSGSDLQRRLFESAERHLAEGLVRKPADADAWLGIAWLRWGRGERGREILDPVLHSLDMAPNKRELWRPRFWLLINLWTALQPDELSRVMAHVRTVWRLDPGMRKSLIEMARGPVQEEFLRRSLADEPGALAEYDKLKGSR